MRAAREGKRTRSWSPICIGPRMAIRCSWMESCESCAAIEKIHKNYLRPHLAALAHHFRAAGDARKAVDYSIAAADAAEAVFAYGDALSHLRPALVIAESDEHDPARRAALLLVLAELSFSPRITSGVWPTSRAL